MERINKLLMNNSDTPHGVKIFFHGAAREVTGSNHLLETSNAKVLIDCGMFQGSDEHENQNAERFKYDPKTIDALFVTHAHIDHIGRIPKLVKEGFHGKIYSTPPTKDLALLLLDDAAHLMDRSGKPAYSAGGPLYTEIDVEKTAELWETIAYHTPFEINGFKVVFREAGHILGSAMVELWVNGSHWLFTGDLGNAASELLPLPDELRDIEYLVMESTYGNRTHEDAAAGVLKLERAVEDVSARKGTLMIPAFATERTQDILHLMNEMVLFRRVPEMPAYVDSPLAIHITSVYEQYVTYYKDEIQELYKQHPNLFKFKKLHLSETVEESKAINDVPPPKVIIAGSGMMTGGRILHHLRRYLHDEKSILLVVGYQAGGSLGRRLLDEAKVVKIFGEEVIVHAQIRNIEGFSAHADSPQLFAFVERTRETLKHVFLVHGEDEQALFMMQEIRDRLGITADAPMLHEEFEI